MTKKEKFKRLVSPNLSNSTERSRNRIRKREMLIESREIAFKILEKLDNLNWSQKQLAEKMEVSPQYVNKLIKGKENITLETQIKLQNILQIPILASYYEKNGFENYKLKISVAKNLEYSVVNQLNYGAFIKSVVLKGSKTVISRKMDNEAYISEVDNCLQPTG